jgi:hypothetical protein
MIEIIYRYKKSLFVGAIAIAIVFGVNIELKSLAPILLSITALAISIYSVFRDSSKIEIAWDICSNNDSSEQWIDIQVVNRGRRPVLIQSIGYFDIAMGSYICADNKSPNDIIQPATMKNYKEKMKFKDMWKVGELFVIDENGKRWSNSKYSRRAFIRMAANCPFDGKHILRTKKYPKYLDKIHKKYLKQIDDSPNKKDIEMKLLKSKEFYLKDHT